MRMNTLLKSTLLSAALAAAPAAGFAAGGDDTSPPKTTNTSKKCFWGKVWDDEKKKCVKPDQSNHTQDQLYDAVRELAYAGQYESAQIVLAAMDDQSDDRVLTYWGFTHRKLGHLDQGHAYYTKALAMNPDNILARSYMGQGFVSEGKLDLAKIQLDEIRTRGGQGTWAEHALATSIENRRTYSY